MTERSIPYAVRGGAADVLQPVAAVAAAIERDAAGAGREQAAGLVVDRERVIAGQTVERERRGAAEDLRRPPIEAVRSAVLARRGDDQRVAAAGAGDDDIH